MSRTFHVLTESECFANCSNNTPSRWVANIAQTDSESIVLAPSSDGSWPFPENRLHIVQGLSTYRSIYHAGGYLLPRVLLALYLRRVLSATLQDLQPRDTVWIHDRPEFAEAIEPFVHQAGARLFLHLHNTHLLSVYESLLQVSKADCHVFDSQTVEREAHRKFLSLGKSAVVSGGLDPQEFHPSEKQAIRSRSVDIPGQHATVIFSAYLAREADLQVFLDAMDILMKRGVPINAKIIGGPNPTATKSYPNLIDRRLHTPFNVAFVTFDSSAQLAKTAAPPTTCSGCQGSSQAKISRARSSTAPETRLKCPTANKKGSSRAQ